MSLPDSRYQQSLHLFSRASEVIPGGVYGHTSPAVTVPGRFPYFAERGEGCRYKDPDGNTYIDYMCAYGPIVLGYNDPEIEEAANKQRRDGNCFNHPTARMVELAETLVEKIDFAGWAVFAKNGADITSWMVQTARTHTARKTILKLAGGYHGTHPWCTPGHYGWLEEERQHIHSFQWNDCEGLLRLVKEHANDVAALVLTPFHHPVFADAAAPSVEFQETVARLQSEHGILLIMDDIRAGFRLHTGGSHRVYGWKPDLVCFCKALGNGYPISAGLGRKELKIAASKVFQTGSYWLSAVPMAVALKCLGILDRDNVPALLEKTGLQLRQGLESLAAKHGKRLLSSGPPAVPTYRFDNDPGFHQFQEFCALAAVEGVFFHPHHNWFICRSHREADIVETLDAAGRAFQKLTGA